LQKIGNTNQTGYGCIWNKMEHYEKFHASFAKAVERFKSWDSSATIQVISHLDADGISSCAILTAALNRENRKYVITIMPQLARENIQDFADNEYLYIMFTDLGSGILDDITNLMKNKEVIVLDHHSLVEAEADNVVHINPHLFGIDGSGEISGSGVAYLFAKELNPENTALAHIAIIGALGDIQEDNGFTHLNDEILQDAVSAGKMEVQTNLNVFGMQTRPIHKVLEYTSDPYIPGISGNESGAVQFLNELGINPKDGMKWRRMIDLDKEEMQKLIAGIVMKRIGEENPEDIIGKSYILVTEEEGSPMRDAKEFATLLNACGRMDKASFGIGACLGIKEDRKKALDTLAEYRKEIVMALRWFEDSKDVMEKGNGYVLMNAKDQVNPTIIGTVASIISKSNGFADKTFVMSLARTEDEMTKVSLRISGLNREEINLREIVKEIAETVGGEAGGHMNAAGALIETSKEELFITSARDILSKAG